MLDPPFRIDSTPLNAESSPARVSRQESAPSSKPHIDRTGPMVVLGEAAALLESLGDTAARELVRLGQLRRRLQQGQFHLAVLGQFKRGKSTFLNALLGEPLLPTSVVPLTAIPTFIRHGRARRIEIRFANDQPSEQFESEDPRQLSAFLSRYVSEQANPENRLAVQAVAVQHPAAILGNGLVLIDTPGIGSTFRHNTQATLNFLPQCDAAVFLVSADPPITEVEVGFLRQVEKQVKRLFFVFNKVDYLDDHEVRAAVAFFQGVLREQLGWQSPPVVFPTSARAALAARGGATPDVWAASGMAAVQDYLIDFLASEKTTTLHEAIAAKAANLLEQTRMQIDLELKTMQMPLDQLEARQAEFRAAIQRAQHQRLTTADLLAGEQRRAAEHLESQADQLRRRTRRQLVAIVHKAQAAAGDQRLEATVEQAMADAIPPLFEQELGRMSRQFAQYVENVLAPYRQQADSLIESVRRQAASLFDIPYRPLQTDRAFKVADQLYWETHSWHARLSPIPPQVVDRLLPAAARRRRVCKRLMRQIDALVVHNVERLRWPTRQSLDTTFRNFANEFDQRLNGTIEATYGAIQAAAKQRREHAAAFTEQMQRLAATREQLCQLIAKLE